MNTTDKKNRIIKSLKSIIPSLAKIAQSIRKQAEVLLSKSSNNLQNPSRIASNYLQSYFLNFKKNIIRGSIPWERSKFADLYAQIVVYGIFSAWIKYKLKNLPKTTFSLETLPSFLPLGKSLHAIFRDLKKIPIPDLQNDFNSLIHQFLLIKEIPSHEDLETIITTFYSDFLKHYDPIISKNWGVIYTPYEIVNYMMTALDHLTISHFGKKEGLISWTLNNEPRRKLISNSKYAQLELFPTSDKIDIDRLRFLDPAAGTLAFTSGLLHKAREKFSDKYSNNEKLAQTAFEQWVNAEFLHNVYNYEILTAPYLLGQIRIYLILESLGITITNKDIQFHSYLRNALQSPSIQPNMDQWVFEYQNSPKLEQPKHKQQKIQDLFIIMGNPPYNLSSQNDCLWINEKILDYKENLDERNLKILSDDYVKFIRFAQWKVKQVGAGIVAYITNSRYLEGQMFTVMRKSLRETFDLIYIVNLHGDMRKKESGNVFDIRVGVSIVFMVRLNDKSSKWAQLHYFNIPHGTKEEKFAKLNEGFRFSTFKRLPETPKNYFVDINTKYLKHFNSFPSMRSFFRKRPISGIMAGKDHLVMDGDIENIKQNMYAFFNRDFDLLQGWKIKINDTKSWQKEKVYDKTSYKESIRDMRRIRYRGFDYKYIAYNRTILEGHRMGYIDQISPNNPAITVSKSSRKNVFCTAFISDVLVEKCYMSVTDTSYAFLLKYNGKSNLYLPKLPFSVEPEQFFYYIYGILWAPTYQERYDEYLRKDFPKIPLTKIEAVFLNMSTLGENLAQAHLLDLPINPHLKKADVDPEKWFIRDYQFNEKEKCLYLDDPEKNAKPPWIKGISLEMWEFSIGTIPQIAQFLNSRKFNLTRKWNTLQRGLSSQELDYFLKMCTAIKLTLKLLPKIGEIYLTIDNLDNFDDGLENKTLY